MPHPTVTPPSWIDVVPWNYLIPAVVLGTLIVGYLLLKNGNGEKIELAPATLHLQLDQITPQKPPENIAINYELHFDPNLAKGSHQLEINGANLIMSRRKEI